MTSALTVLGTVALLCFLHTGFADPKTMKCYECNVWKAGYGTKCDKPLIRDECYFCMKIYTKTYVGYYKNRPKVSEVESRVCGRSRTVPYENTCVREQTMDGHTTHCYCNNRDLCNSAVVRKVVTPVILCCAVFAFLVSRWWSNDGLL